IPQEVERLEAKTILVAWKDTREARLAVWEALPFLQKCDKAIVVEIDESKDPTAARARVNDVVEWLQRHDVKATGTVPPLVDAPAMQLDTIAWEEGADLIVAGAYGHSRFREWVLGGVTRDFIMRTPRCTLLAH
ncbi:MAG: universal stress protein, partial [Beijerinckiaceae bacterium]